MKLVGRAVPLPAAGSISKTARKGLRGLHRVFGMSRGLIRVHFVFSPWLKILCSRVLVAEFFKIYFACKI